MDFQHFDLNAKRLQRFDLLEKHGCTAELANHLNYAYEKVDMMIAYSTG